MVRLTEEEIWAELGIPLEERHLRICRGEFNAFKKGNKAQLKKVVGLLKEHHIALENDSDVFVIGHSLWQALLEEIQ